MDNKFLILIGLIFFAGITIGGVIGQVITQIDYDNTDFSKQNLNLTVNNIKTDDSALIVNLSYETIRQVKGEYQLIASQTTINYKLEDYYECRLIGNNKTSCITKARDSILKQVQSFTSNERTYLTQQKTQEKILNIKKELQSTDFNFTVQELNGGKK